MGIIRGEGELILLDILNEIYKLNPDFSSIKGFSYQLDGVFYRNADREPELCLDQYGIPSRDVLDAALKNNLDCNLNFLAGRGCPYNCSFCTGNKFYNPLQKKSWRIKDVKKVVDEIQATLKKYESEKSLHEIINFCDLNFINSTQEGTLWLENFVAEIKKRNLNFLFYILTRVDSINQNKDLVKKLRNVGLVQIEIGLEAGSDFSLDVFNKHITVSQSYEAVNYLNELKIDIGSSGFIMFHPYVTIKELRENAKFLLNIDYWKVMHLVTRAALFPGSEITSSCKKDNLVLPSFNHYKVFDYLFQDPGINLLYTQLQTINYRMLNATCNTSTFIKTNLILNYRKIEKSTLIKDEELSFSMEKIERPVREAIQSNQNVLNTFFNNLLCMSECGWNQKEFEKLKYLFTQEYCQQGKKISLEFSQYALKIQELLERLQR